MNWQQPLPEEYRRFTDAELAQAIAERKRELGDRLVILGHHYQQDEVIRFADFTGDSFRLSQLAAERVTQTGAEYVVFAGVHFMAESADILTPPSVKVVLPDMGAGCSMADMADIEDTLEAWRRIQKICGSQHIRVIPICYMNSTAAIKAFCGEYGGAVCTSSNCRRIFEWALAGGEQPLKPGERVQIMFLPDQHLGRNTAYGMGYNPQADMVLWDPADPNGLGGTNEKALTAATFILWKGHCSVHQLFRPEHVDQIRAQWPDVRVIVHPECSFEVLQKADMTGSTEQIIRAIESAPTGSRWSVGTEVHLVNRLAKQAAERGVKVRILSDCQCLCSTMYRIDMPHLLWVLDHLVEGKVINQITVPDRIRHWAIVAMRRMLDIGAVKAAPMVAANSAQ